MNLFENKRAVSLTGGFALAFAGLMAYGFSVSSDTKAKIAECEEAQKALKSQTEAVLPPSSKTVAALEAATKSMTAQSASLKKGLTPCINTCKKLVTSSAKNNEIFGPQHLAAARKWLDDKINANGGSTFSRPGGDQFTFGLGRDYNERQDAANPDTTPYLLYQLNAARTLAGYVADSGAISLDRMYCEPVPSEDDGERTALHIELSFTAKRGAIPTEGGYESPLSKVLNAIKEGKGVVVPREGKAESGEYFFVLRGFNASTVKGTYKDKQEYTPTVREAGAETVEPEQIATLLVGDADDEVRFNLVIEAVYFSESEN